MGIEYFEGAGLLKERIQEKEEWLGFCYLKSENIEVGGRKLEAEFGKRTVDWL